jgi:putative solute:sodium symporter small subunit
MTQEDISQDPQAKQSIQRYWRHNVLIILSFLCVWFIVAIVLGVILVEQLNTVKLGGFPLGFWIAQQGSIYCFVIIILVYCCLMEYGDKKFHLEESKRKEQPS